MKHITFADKNFLVGDSIADALLEYAAMLAETDTADSIDLNAIGADGDEVQATLFLSAGVPLVAETSHNSLPEPDNTEMLAYIEGRLALHVNPPVVTASELPPGDASEVEDWLKTQE
jgi:hypothetical protein